MTVIEIEVKVTSDMSRDDIYAELFAGSVQCAEVRLSHGAETVVTIYPQLDGRPHEFSVDALQNALTEAVNRLHRLEGIEPNGRVHGKDRP